MILCPQRLVMMLKASSSRRSQGKRDLHLDFSLLLTSPQCPHSQANTGSCSTIYSCCPRIRRVQFWIRLCHYLNFWLIIIRRHSCHRIPRLSTLFLYLRSFFTLAYLPRGRDSPWRYALTPGILSTTSWI